MTSANQQLKTLAMLLRPVLLRWNMLEPVIGLGDSGYVMLTATTGKHQIVIVTAAASERIRQSGR